MPQSDSAPQDAAVAAVLDALSAPALLLGGDGRIRHANSAWHAKVAALADSRLTDVHRTTDYVGLTRALARTPEARAFADDLDALLRGDVDEVRYEYAFHGRVARRWYRLEATRLDAADRFLITHVDVTAQVLANQENDWLARHDPLTGLPNRRHLHELVDAELDRTGRGPLSVLLLDVDGFSDVNDASGQEGGDELLRQVALRLRRVARGSDVIGRLGDDEFLLVSPDCGADCAALVARRCQAALAAEPFEVAGRVMRLGASVGVATAAAGTVAEAAGLVRDADLALSAARATGRGGLRSFAAELRSAAERRATLGTELAHAIDAGELVLHYQPVMYLPNGDCSGVEALVRWQHPQRGLLMPAEFLDAAAKYDLLTAMARWVLHEATRQTAAWAEKGLRLVTGVNINAGHFTTGTLVDDVLGALTAAGLPPEHLVLELTETSVAEDPERAAVQFAELRRRGVEVSIDDFGSGYSSLGQLVSIPVGVLKIDRSLVAYPAGRRCQAAAAIAAVVALGQACGMRVLAEGVETAEQLALAVELGCTFAQGYHIARPMPADQLYAWMLTRSGGRPPEPQLTEAAALAHTVAVAY